MVRQIRTGRFGQAIAIQNQQPEEITPDTIRDEPRIPEGRFGRSLKVTEGLRERARQISNIRGEAISEAQRLEEQFFSQRITISQAEEEYNKIDPRVRQFIKTTPEARRQMARKVLGDIDTTIASNESAIIRLSQRGGSEAELEILERQQTIQELNQLRDKAEGGAFTFEDLLTVAEAKARNRRLRAENRQSFEMSLKSAPSQIQTSEIRYSTRPKTTDELVSEGVPRDIAGKLSSQQPISLEEFYRLPKNIRQQSGLSRKDFEGEAQQVPPTNFQKIIGKLFPKAKPTKFAVEKFGEQKAQKLATDLSAIGITAGLSLSGVPKLPKTVRIPTRELRLPRAIETQRDVIAGGKLRTLSEFDITTEVKAPSKLVDLTKGTGFIGTPKVIKTIPREVRLTKTVLPVVDEGKVVTLTSGKGAKSFNVETLVGASRKITPQQIQGLSKTQKFLFTRATGSKVPVASKNVGRLLGKRQDLSLGFIQKTKLGKISRPVNLKKLNLQGARLRLLGKSKTRFEVVSKVKPVGETKDFELFKGKLFFKDITKPLARARGKTPRMNILIRRSKEPLILDTITDVKVLRPFGRIKKTPLSLAFPKQELKQIAKPLIKLPRQTSQSIKTIKGTRLSGKFNVLVGGVRGNLAQSNRGLSSDFTRGFKSSNLPSSSAQQKPKTFEKALPRTLTTTNLAQVPRTNLVSMNKSLPRFVQKDIVKQVPREALKLNQKLIPKLTLKSLSKLSPKTSSARPLFRTRPRQFTKPFFRLPRFKQRTLRIPRESQRTPRSDLALVESFTARELRLRPQKIRARDIGKALARQQNIGRIRLRPIIIEDVIRRRKRRR